MTNQNKKIIFEKDTFLGKFQLKPVKWAYQGNIFIYCNNQELILQYDIDRFDHDKFYLKIDDDWYEIISTSIIDVPVGHFESYLGNYCYHEFVEYDEDGAYIEDQRERFFTFNEVLKPIKATEYFKLIDN